MNKPIDLLSNLADYQTGGIVSRKIVQKPAGSITVFAFDKDEGLSEHTAAYDAMVYMLEGEGEFLIDGESHRVKAGEFLILPANHPHAVNAPTRFKMLLTMIRA